MELKVKLAVLHAKQVEDTLIRSRKHHEVESVPHIASLPWAGNAVLQWPQMFMGRCEDEALIASLALLLPPKPDIALGWRKSELQPHPRFLLLYARTVVVPGNSACLEHNTHACPFSYPSALELGLPGPS